MFSVKAPAKATTKAAALTGALVCAVVALAPFAEAASRRNYRGHTAQKRVVRVAVTGGHLKLLHFSARLKCRDGSILVDDESGFLPTPLRGGGRFSDMQVGSTDEVRFRGRLRGGAVRGKLRVADRVGKVRCDSGWVSFAAKA